MEHLSLIFATIIITCSFAGCSRESVPSSTKSNRSPVGGNDSLQDPPRLLFVRIGGDTGKICGFHRDKKLLYAIAVPESVNVAFVDTYDQNILEVGLQLLQNGQRRIYCGSQPVDLPPIGNVFALGPNATLHPIQLTTVQIEEMVDAGCPDDSLPPYLYGSVDNVVREALTKLWARSQ